MYHVIEVSDSYKVMTPTEYKEHCIQEGKDMKLNEETLFKSKNREESNDFCYELNNELIECEDSLSDMSQDYMY